MKEADPERAFQAARRRLLQVQRVAGMGFWDWDLHSHDLVVTDEVYRICGVEKSECETAEVLGRRVVHPDDLGLVQIALADALAGKKEFDLDVRIARPDGAIRWVNAAAEIARDDDGNPLSLLGTMLDITHRKHVEDTLRTSEQRLLLLHSLNEALQTALPDRVMPVALHILGEHLQASRCAFGSVAADGDTFSVPHDYTQGCRSIVGQYRLSALGATGIAKLKRGQVFVVRDVRTELPASETELFDAVQMRATISCSLVRAGVVRAMLAVHQTTPRDWTDAEICLVREVAERLWATIEQRTAETKLRESEMLLRIASRAAHIGGWTIELPSLEVTWSDEVCAIHDTALGTKPTLEQAIGYCAPEFRKLIRDSMRACTTDGTPFDVELQIVSAKGRLVWARAIGHPERDGEGRITRIHGAFQDITARRKLEEQFRQAQKLEAVGQLAGGVAHDFNNLMSVVLSYSSLIASALPADSPVRADIDEIRRAGERAGELTHQLLAFTRQQVLQPRVVDWNQIVIGMHNMLKRLLGDQVALSVMPAPNIGKMRADPGQIEQVIMNLVVNARDAMPNGGNLTLETANVELKVDELPDEMLPGRYVMLSVSDNGGGMSAATRSRIWEPFFTTKEKAKGTGLGLSTVHGIVTQSGGCATVHSEPGLGTTFKIYFPRVDAEAAASADRITALPVTLRGSETILVVEDDEQVRNIVHSILRRNGYNVLEAQNGGEAFLICEQHRARIDLLLTDVVMPRMNGRELAERVRSMRPQMKVLYMSGYTEDSIVLHGVLGAEIAFLQKPFTPASLLKKVREVLATNGHAATALRP